MNCKVLRVGIFFDGTGNNLVNDKQAQNYYPNRLMIKGNKLFAMQAKYNWIVKV